MKTFKKLLALVLAGTMLAGCLVGCGGSADNSTPLVIASADMSEKFSPFFADSTYDQNVVDFTQVALLGNTRAGEIVYKGIEGETYAYNGTDYKYKGIADCTVTENADGTVTFKTDKFSVYALVYVDSVVETTNPINPINPTNPISPNTGDDTNVVPLLVLFTVGIVLVVNRKKKFF
jgi:hypothetical protein